jgi:adenine phosphoribosyltransferase
MNFKSELKKQYDENSGYLISSELKLYKQVISKLSKPFSKNKIDKIMSLESKGLLYGPAVALKLNKPFVAIFKTGRIPNKFVFSKKYKDYSKKIKSIDVGKITVNKGERIILVDDAIESGESAKAAIKLIEKLGGKVIGISVIYGIAKIKDYNFFKKYKINFLLKV